MALNHTLLKQLHYSPCNLCPRLCMVDRTSSRRGICGAKQTMMISRAAPHVWEEPPLSCGAGSGAIFFTHCSLRCVYCQNYHIAQGGYGKEISIEKLVDIMLALQKEGVCNINLVTPTHFMPSIQQALTIARSKGLILPVVWNTSGYERSETLDALSGMVDIFLTDYKYASSKSAQTYSHAPDYPAIALRAIHKMHEMIPKQIFDTFENETRMLKGVVVRHLILPGHIDESKKALHTLYETFGNTIVYSIMNQYTPLKTNSMLEAFPHLREKVSDKEYEEVLDFADYLGIEDYFWQTGGACEESFIPEWNFSDDG